MAERALLPEDDLTPVTLRGAITRTLPHGAFGISPADELGPGSVRVLCSCGRSLRWFGYLPSDVLLWWLADHDDEMFLPRSQLERTYGEHVPDHLDISRYALSDVLIDRVNGVLWGEVRDAVPPSPEDAHG